MGYKNATHTHTHHTYDKNPCGLPIPMHITSKEDCSGIQGEQSHQTNSQTLDRSQLMQTVQVWGTYYSSSSLDRGGKTWVLKAVGGSGYDDDNDKGKDNGLYCQHC